MKLNAVETLQCNVSTMKFFIFLFIAIILYSCSASKESVAFNLSYYQGTSSSYSKESVKDTDRIIILNAYITLEVETPEKTTQKIIELSKKYNGYTVSSSNSYVTLRVEADKLNNTIDDIEKLGEVTNKNISGQDVTDDYKDTEIVLDNLNKAREKYLLLLEKAENVSAALQVEKELERINNELNLVKGKLNRLTHLKEYSTINVTIEKEVTPGPVGWIFYGLYKTVVWLFVW